MESPDAPGPDRGDQLGTTRYAPYRTICASVHVVPRQKLPPDNADDPTPSSSSVSTPKPSSPSSSVSTPKPSVRTSEPSDRTLGTGGHLALTRDQGGPGTSFEATATGFGTAHHTGVNWRYYRTEEFFVLGATCCGDSIDPQTLSLGHSSALCPSGLSSRPLSRQGCNASWRGPRGCHR